MELVGNNPITVNASEINTTSFFISKNLTSLSFTANGVYQVAAFDTDGTVITNLPNTLTTQTIYWAKIGSLLDGFTLYLEESTTTKIVLNAAAIAGVTSFQIKFITQKTVPIPCFHSGSTNISDVECCDNPSNISNIPTTASINVGGNVLTFKAYGGEPVSTWPDSMFLYGANPGLYRQFNFDLNNNPHLNEVLSIETDPQDSTQTKVKFTKDNGGTYKRSFPHADLPTTFTMPIEISNGVFPNSIEITLSGSIQMPSTAKIVMPNAYFYSQEGNINLGNIDETLAWDGASCCYFSTLKNYHKIPGRIYLKVSDMFPSVSSGKKFISESIGKITGFRMKYKNADNQIDPSDPGINGLQICMNYPVNNGYTGLIHKHDPGLTFINRFLKTGVFFDSRLNFRTNATGSLGYYDLSKPERWYFAVSYAGSANAMHLGNLETIDSYGNYGVNDPDVFKTRFWAIRSDSPTAYFASL